jgi:beta-glucanase (GH16 family)
MKNIFIIIILFFSIFLHSQVMWQVKSNFSKKWFLQENDEFNEDGLNTILWKTGYPWGNYVYNLDLLYKSENVVFENGTLSLITKKTEKPEVIIGEYIDTEFLKKKNKFPNEKGEFFYNYSGGAISSIKQYKYGYFEIRFKANEEKGIWPAFWLYGGGPNEEIDFYEGKGERENQIHVDVHCPKGCEDYKGGFLNLKKNWGAWIKTKESLANDWNIISGEWQPNYVKFFLNGQPIGYFEGEFKTAQNLIINSAVAKNKEAFNPGPDEKTKFPNSFLVDYVRIWSQEDTIYDIKDKYKLFENTSKTINNNDLYNTQPKSKVNFIYDKKELSKEEGCITLLPVFYNKYSLSIAGKNLGKIQVDVIDRFNAKAAGFSIENSEYYIMDLSALPTGPYTIKINVLNQIITHNVPVINPEKIGEQK